MKVSGAISSLNKFLEEAGEEYYRKWPETDAAQHLAFQDAVIQVAIKSYLLGGTHNEHYNKFKNQ